MTPDAITLQLSRGTLHAHRWGDSSAPAVLCVPGLSANSLSFDALASALIQDARRQVIAFDLRGRGNSPATGPGTYGWENHAKDVVEAADALKLETFDCVGHSMGAFITLQLLALAGARVRRAVLIDAAGKPDEDSITFVRKGTARLTVGAPSADAYVEMVRGVGTVTPWHEQWEHHYRYELQEDAGGVRPRTSAEAVLEDLEYGLTHDARKLWGSLSPKTLALRAARPFLNGQGFVFTEEDAARLRDAVPGLQLEEIDANHFGIMTHPQTLAAVRRFLDV